jgi:2-polyprenyl-6-methoxyphenol hydroxylase-like FAD-dependent oxidoreductase
MFLSQVDARTNHYQFEHMTTTRPVLIVGAGPTGMTAAIELNRFGIPVRLIDKLLDPLTTSRAIGVQARTLELFELRGLADAMLEAGKKRIGASFYRHGTLIFRMEFSGIESRYSLYVISQAETERILRERLIRQGVAIEQGVTFIAFAQADRDGSLTATLRHSDGRLEEFEPSYLIDAEGAHSIIRSTLGIEFKGKSREQHYALGDLFIDGDLPETDVHLFSSEYGFLGLFPMGNRRFRIMASNPLSQNSKDPGPRLEELQKLYDMRSHVPAKLHDLGWTSWFRINSRMVNQLQANRIFLGGDTAHIHSPAGGQGMNTGIQDMINLGWKLALVIQGRASTTLLETYGEERLPVIRDVLANTERLTDVAWEGGDRSLYNPSTDLGAQFATRMSQISVNYTESPLSSNHANPGELRAGMRVPDISLMVWNKPHSAEQEPYRARMFSLLDPSRFTLLYVNVAVPETLHARVQAHLAPWRDLIEIYEISPVEAPVEHKHFTDKLGTSRSIFLVRPDSYIGYIGDENSVPQLAEYLAKWLTPGTVNMDDKH